ncbi:GNAT family N-acetyltransferase [Streptomyces sp. N2-109]|uniref:GNAT family N-acetyltransferase n=1 Tax=Streptomyces gossypii TaxID=2883101 RepID=A0ABT2K0X2_9ACTN|nr:GNAT family N-acetyltransferase [Streptomyces gossypii]MCT2593553.1 GNAT family N-acetyltransferase [Streptomyces gossypii]
MTVRNRRVSVRIVTTVEFHTLPEAHVDRALDHAHLVFHETPEEKTRKQHRDLLLRCERIGAYEGDRLVGLAAALPFQLSVPGGELPVAGLTFVSVAPTHRRRGVLTGLLDESARRCAVNGQPLSVLWASEAAIYGRFGFGPATGAYSVEIDSTRPLDLRLAPDERPLRLVAPDEAPALLAAAHSAQRAVRAGRIARDEHWWREEVLREEDEDYKELSPPRVVVLGGDEVPPGGGAPRPSGYAVYRTRGGNEELRTSGLVQVTELEADTPAVAASLWRYLVSIDLTGQVRAPGRPLDDPLLLFAADRDQVRVTDQSPALWLRLTDPATALTARSWAAPVDVVLEVTDVRLPANAGRFRLTAGPAGATYRPTSDAAELALDIRELGACYLGGAELTRMVLAGLVTEHSPGAAARLDAALRTTYLPHATDGF